LDLFLFGVGVAHRGVGVEDGGAPPLVAMVSAPRAGSIG